MPLPAAPNAGAAERRDPHPARRHGKKALVGVASLALLAAAGCDGSDPATKPYLHQVREGAPADAQKSDAELLARARDICGRLRPGDPPSWQQAVAYVVAHDVPTNQAWREVDYASTLYCPGKRSSLSHTQYALHGG